MDLIKWLIFGLYFLPSSAQEAIKDSLFVIKYTDKINVGTYLSNTSNSFELLYIEDGVKKSFDLIPNNRDQIGLSLNYKIIDISFGFSPHFLAENRGENNTSVFSFNTRLFYKKWMQSLLFINQKGFFIGNDEFTFFFPKFRSTKYGGTTSFIFNDAFSYKTILNEREWQRRSAGSFIPSLSFYYTNLDLNEGVDPESNSIILTLSPAYFHNFVIHRNILISAGIGIGGGIDILDGMVTPIVEVSQSLKLAYNKPTFFSALSVSATRYALEESKTDVQLNDDIILVKLSVGMRLDAPKKVSDFYQKTTEKFLKK